LRADDAAVARPQHRDRRPHGRRAGAAAGHAGSLHALGLRAPERISACVRRRPSRIGGADGDIRPGRAMLRDLLPGRGRAGRGRTPQGRQHRGGRPGAVGRLPWHGGAGHLAAGREVGGAPPTPDPDARRPAGRARAGLISLAAGLAVLAAWPVAAAPRVFSLDQCADQYVLALSPREAIVGLSARADDADSRLREQARGLPLRRATLESVLAARPDVVVRHWGGDEKLLSALRRRGIAVVEAPEATSFDDVRLTLREIGAALGQSARAEVLVREMDDRLAR